MKILVLCLAIFGSVLIGLMGMFPHGYISSNGINNYFEDHSTGMLAFYAIMSLLLAWLFFEIYKSKAKNKMDLYVSPLLLGLFFFFFSFLHRDAQLSFFNSSGSAGDVVVRGIITGKKIVHGRGRSQQRSFFVTVTDSVLRRRYSFNVSDYVFNRTVISDSFNKMFSLGRLGVLYRKEQE
jgi:hypothetical protein